MLDDFIWSSINNLYWSKFSISDFDQIKNLEDKVLCFDNKFLKSKFIFDYFHNKKLNEVKIGFRFIFQSKERTLEDTEVELIMKDIIEIALKIKGVSIPGLSQWN